jgi:hypothetical protein
MRPAKAYWDFGVGNVIQGMNRDPAYVSLKRADADKPDPRGYFAAEDCKRIQGEYPNFRNPGNGYFEIGGDFGQVFDGKQHSTGIIGIRGAALPFADRSQDRFIKPLLVIPGPNEPTTLQPYLEDIAKFFAEHGPQGTPLCFREREQTGRALKDSKETLWLLGAYGDTPFRAKLANWLGHTAILGCGFCVFEGVSAGRGTHYPGYSEPHKFVRTARFEGQSFLAGDETLFLNHTQQKARANVAEKAKRELREQGKSFDPGVYGCKGQCVFVKYLDYVSYSSFFILPIYHAMLYGVCKDFWNLCYPHAGSAPASNFDESFFIPTAGKALIAQREAHLHATSEYTRVHGGLKKKSDWTMDQYLHFALTWSAYVIGDGRGILHPELFKLWQHLRTAIKHYCFVPASHEGDALFVSKTVERTAGRAALFQYASGMQKLAKAGRVPWSMLTSNLHLLCCQLYRQETDRGHIGMANEFWVERLVQRAKHTTRNRTSHEPERLMVNSLLEQEGLSVARRNFTNVCDIPERRAADQALAASEADIDKPASDGCMCIGMPHQAKPEVMEQARELLAEYLASGTGSELGLTTEHLVDLAMYKRANANGIDLLWSELYRHDRVNHYVYVVWQDAGAYVGEIQYFILARLTSPDGGEDVVVRLAVLLCWKATSEHDELYHGDLLSIDASKPWKQAGKYSSKRIEGIQNPILYTLYPVELASIKHKLNLVKPTTGKKWYFLKPYVNSRRQ